MDDEAMLRLDAQLGAYVKSMLQRGGSSARERGAALRNLQLRAAALLEEWIRRCPRSPLAATAASGPLLRALAAAARPGGSPPLAERLRALAAGRLAKCRPDLSAAAGSPGSNPDADAEALRGAMKAALYYASREKDARVAGAAAAVLGMLLAAPGAPGAPAPARAAAADFAAATARDLVEKKKSRLGRSAAEAILLRAPHAAFSPAGDGSGLSAAAVLSRAAAAGRTDFVRAEALELLAAALSKAPPDVASDALKSQLQRGGAGGGAAGAPLAAALVSGVQGPFKTKERHAAAAKAAVTIVEAAKKLLPPGGRLPELLGPDALTGVAKAVAAVRVRGSALRGGARRGLLALGAARERRGGAAAAARLGAWLCTSRANASTLKITPRSETHTHMAGAGRPAAR